MSLKLHCSNSECEWFGPGIDLQVTRFMLITLYYIQNFQAQVKVSETRHPISFSPMIIFFRITFYPNKKESCEFELNCKAFLC